MDLRPPAAPAAPGDPQEPSTHTHTQAPEQPITLQRSLQVEQAAVREAGDEVLGKPPPYLRALDRQLVENRDVTKSELAPLSFLLLLLLLLPPATSILLSSVFGGW